MNGENLSNGFRDMSSTKSGPTGTRFDKLLAHRQAPMGQMTLTLDNYRCGQIQRALNRDNPPCGFRDTPSLKSGAAACPPEAV